MLGESNRLNQVKMRKQLLVEESELNRDHFTHVSLTLKEEVITLAKGAQTLGSMCSAASMLVAGIANIRRKHRPIEPRARSSWLQVLNKGAVFVSSLWRGFNGIK